MAAEISPDSGELRTLMTVASLDTAAAPPRRRVGLKVAVGLAIVSLLGLAFFLRPQSSSAAHGAAAPSQAAVPQPLDTAPPPVASPPTVASAAPDEPESPVVAPAAPSAAEPAAPATPHRPVKRAPSKCDPPYRIDGSGHKIFKVECL